TIEAALAQGRDIRRPAVGVAAWMAFIRRQARAGVEITDPLSAQLTDLGRATIGDARADVARFLTLSAVFPADLAAVQPFRTALEAAYADITGPAPRRVLALQ